MQCRTDVRSVLFVHQGAELYGSDRSLLVSVRAVRERYPTAKIDVLLPGSGPLLAHLAPYVDDIKLSALFVARRKILGRLLLLAPVSFPLAFLKALKLAKRYDLVYINTQYGTPS